MKTKTLLAGTALALTVAGAFARGEAIEVENTWARLAIGTACPPPNPDRPD